jgi:hypothetical protein
VQKDEATNLVCAAINAGIFNDLGSGSNVDLCIITKVNSVPWVILYKKTVFLLTVFCSFCCRQHCCFQSCDSHKVMNAFIVMLPSNVVVEIFLQFHR